MSSHVLTGLVAKHRELKRDREFHERQLGLCSEALVHLERTILLFDPEYPVNDIAAKKMVELTNPDRGHIGRKVLEVLQLQQKPIMVAELTDRVSGRLQSPPATASERARLFNAINSALGQAERRGLVVRVGWGERAKGRGRRPALWQLVNDGNAMPVSANNPEIPDSPDV